MASAMNSQRTIRYIVGDIGGTNSRLLLVERVPLTAGKGGAAAESKQKKREELIDGQFVETVVAQKIYPSKKYSDLTTIIASFLAEHPGQHPEACALAVAGPVHNNRAHITNLNWFPDGPQMSHALNIPHVKLLNDFEAIGYGLLALEPSDVKHMNPAVKPEPKAVKSCLGAGTGLGETFLTFNGRDYDVWPAEGGHASFAARDEIEYQLAKFFKESERLASFSVERLVSGPAIPKIYDFFAKRQPELVKPAVHAAIRDPKNDAGEIIANHALKNTDTLCVDTLDMFVKLYGAEAGDFALKTLPFGGLYIAGGIAPKILPLMEKNDKFRENMLSKGRLRSVLERIPVFIVLHPQVGLLGARVIARRFIRDAEASASAPR